MDALCSDESVRNQAARRRGLTPPRREGLLALAAVHPHYGYRSGYRNTRTRIDTAETPTVAFLNGPVIHALHDAGMVEAGWNLSEGWEGTNARYGGHVRLTERGMDEALALLEIVESLAQPSVV